jgi:hypothetical protein
MRFEWHRLCVNLMKRAKTDSGPWSDLEWELSGRNRNFEAWINIMRFVFYEEHTR